MLTQENPAVNKAVGVLMELNTSQRRRMLAESREKARRDYQARFEGAYTSDKEEGKKEIAKNAVAQGLSMDTISAITGLPIDIIQRLSL